VNSPSGEIIEGRESWEGSRTKAESTNLVPQASDEVSEIRAGRLTNVDRDAIALCNLKETQGKSGLALELSELVLGYKVQREGKTFWHRGNRGELRPRKAHLAGERYCRIPRS